jgi:cysteine desulfurase/selenocysteine lyase
MADSKDLDGSGTAGLPDDATLSLLASELFQTPPGLSQQAPTAPTRPVQLVPPGSPPGGGLSPQSQMPPMPYATSLPMTPPFKATPQTAAEYAAPSVLLTPRLVPTQAVSADLPGVHSTVLPTLPRGGGPVAGVPEASAAIAETAPSAAKNPSVSPFYFVSEPAASALPTLDLSQFSAFSPPSLPLSTSGLPTTAGLPGAIPANGVDATVPRHPIAPSSTPGFYFTDFGGTGSSHRQPTREVPAAQDQGLFDVHAIRRDFPILATRVNGGKNPLVWFDNAATTQKPQSVIDRLAYFYANENSNIHRAAHELAARATDAYEAARKKVAKFIGASSPEEIVFVRGTTEAINLVSFSWGKQNIQEGDEIVISHLEHHANIVPWQMLAAEKGAKLRVIPVDELGQVRLDEYQKLLSSRTKIVSVTQVSNALGTVVPVKQIVDMGHRAGARVLIDGAQSVSHLRVDMQALDADFFVFSGHKIFGPTGIGVVYGKREVLEDMPPYQGGGNMIEDVTFDKTTYHGPPTRFEAGTGNIADAVGLGEALDYVERLGIENIARYEHELLEYGTQGLCTVPGLRLIGTAPDKTSVMSFVLDGFTNQEVGQVLSEEGIAVRTGHHCAQPILRRYGLESTVRPSLAFYNTHQEIDLLVTTLHRLARSRR